MLLLLCAHQTYPGGFLWVTLSTSVAAIVIFTAFMLWSRRSGGLHFLI